MLEFWEIKGKFIKISSSHIFIHMSDGILSISHVHLERRNYYILQKYLNVNYKQE